MRSNGDSFSSYSIMTCEDGGVIVGGPNYREKESSQFSSVKNLYAALMKLSEERPLHGEVIMQTLMFRGLGAMEARDPNGQCQIKIPSYVPKRIGIKGGLK